MALTITDARALSMCNDLVDAFDNSGSAPTLVIYTGSAPGPGNAASGTLLVSLDLDTTAAFGAASMSGSNAVATLSGLPVSATIAATGDAGYFRMNDDAGAAILEGTVGTSGADLILDTISLVQDATFQITSLTISVPTQGA
jgi:hypothetical protein